MRYYFHLESETNIQIDHGGRDFDRHRDALDHAFALARDLGEDEKWLGWSVRVIDEDNAEVLCVPIFAAIGSE